MSVVAAALAAALTTVSLQELIKLDFRVWGLPVIPLVALLVAFGLVGGVFAYVLTEGRLPKARLRKWFKVTPGNGP